MTPILRLTPLALAFLPCLSASARAQASYVWGSEFDTPQIPYSGMVHDTVVFDDGTGPALYLAGNFRQFHGEVAYSVVRYDGEEWSPVGGGLLDFNSPADVRALEVFDPDGNGPAAPLLVAAGAIHNVSGFLTPIDADNVVAWDGTSWSALGGITDPGPGGGSWPIVFDLASFDDGSGPGLYAAGIFAVSGSTGIAVWDGSSWDPVGGTGTAQNSSVRALQVWDDGSGPALYAGGPFSEIGGIPNTSGIARWDGTSWSALGPTNFGTAQGFAIYDPDGAGPASEVLVAAAQGSLDVWDGATLTKVAGFNGPLTTGIAVYDDGSGPAVYVGANSLTTFLGERMHRWNGVSPVMVPVGDPLRPLLTDPFHSALFVYEGTLYGSGLFSGTDAAPSKGLLAWDNGNWADPFPSRGFARFNPSAGSSANLDPSVLGAVPYDDGAGERLFVGGVFTHAGGVPVGNSIAAWDGDSFADAGPLPIVDPIESARPLGTWDDGGGEALYVGVSHSVPELWKLRGTAWSPVGASTANFARDVSAMAIFDMGAGEQLYVAEGDNVHRFDGFSWTLVGTANNFVNDLEVLTGIGGTLLYAGGNFSTMDGVAAANLARFDGTNWTAVGGGPSGGVSSLVTADLGSGPQLFVGGSFGSAGGVAGTSGIASWDGGSWSSVGGGAPGGEAYLIGAYSDGTTTRLYTQESDNALVWFGNFVRSWNGTQWQTLPDSFTGGSLEGLVDFDDGFGRSAYFWGDFQGTGGQVAGGLRTTIDTANQSGGLVRFGEPRPDDRSFCHGDGGNQMGCTSCPCGNDTPPGTRGGCINSVGANGLLLKSGTASVSSDTLRFQAEGLSPQSFALLFSGAAQAPANAANPCFGLASGIATSTFDGLRCAVQDFQRHGARPSNSTGEVGTTTNGWGLGSGPPGGLLAFFGFSAGQTRHFQAIYRDNPMGGCNTGLNTSQGITVNVRP